MLNLHKRCLLFFTLAITGCGGGGGNSGGGGSGGGVPTPPTSNGTAEIIFPWASSAATAQIVTVRGTATDPEGVASVSVNGTVATVTAASSTSSPGFFTKTGSGQGDVTWSAKVTLASGENALVVSVEDTSGDITGDVDRATIDYVEVPITFTLDPNGARVVGLSNSLTPTGYVQKLVQHNYDTLEQTVFDGIGTAPATSCFRSFENEFLYLSFFTGSWELRKYDLTAAQDSLLTEIPPATLDGGPNFQDGSVRQLVCGGTHTSAYVLVNHVDQSGAGHSGSAYAKSRVLEIDLATFSISNLSESDTMQSPRWIAQGMALANNSIVTLRDINSVLPLTSVSLANGSRTDLAPDVDAGGFVLQPELANDRVYVVTFDGIDEIVGLGTGSKRNISPVGVDHPLAFSQIRSMGIDAANNRVVVGDEDLDTLIAVDVTTGERSELLTRKVGTGIALVAPRHFAISSDGTRAYVADDGGNVAERVFEIDLATGDRRTIGDISQPFNEFVSGLALDEAGGRVFVAFQDVILEVDLGTETVRTIVDVGSSNIDSVSSLLPDPDNNRLLIGDFGNDSIFAFDLATETLALISQENVNGSGPAFGGIVSMTAVATTPDIYVAGQTSELVTRVNLDTGDRATLATSCALGTAGTFANLGQVRHNESADELLINGDRLYSLDLQTGQCNILPKRVSVLEFQPTADNQLLAVTFGALLQLDRETGEVVIVSK